jgi:uncharacterized repeat protein (TIGR03803 family)
MLWEYSRSRRTRRSLLVLLLTSAALLVCVPAIAQTFAVLHDFTGGLDGRYPYAGVTIDHAGTLYGTASEGGPDENGAVFRLALKNGSWIFNPLYHFVSGEGVNPLARVIIGPNGSLYGTTSSGPSGCGGCGTVFNLKPTATIPTSVIAPWNEKVLYQFTDGSDGASPGNGDLLFDNAGNIYGTTFSGGDLQACGGFGCGVVYKLTPNGGGWTQSVIHAFTGGSDGATPYSGLTPDSDGNFYATTVEGGAHGYGTVYKLSPTGSGWTKTVLYDFQNSTDGKWPVGGLVIDVTGNLFGAAEVGGSGGGGTVYKLANPNGQWIFSIVYSFSGHAGPYSKLTMDAAGDLYGSTYGDGSAGVGMVFKLTRSGSGWIFGLLHDFTGGSDGMSPLGGVALDASGRVYGTAQMGGAYGQGVVFQITP